ncbi:transposable element tcb2 transposase [Trichonephila clavipes]|nr:transposable element tcb2 transposase [Trichonephila clavipes]
MTASASPSIVSEMFYILKWNEMMENTLIDDVSNSKRNNCSIEIDLIWKCESPSPNYHTTPTGGRFSYHKFSMNRCPTRRVFSGTGLELVTKPAMIRYLYNSATAATGQRFATMEMKVVLSTILRHYTVESLDSRDVILPSLKIHFKSSILQDNETPHSSRIATELLQEHSSEFRHFRWPPKSPDMNIIEYIWNALQRAVQKRSPPLLAPTDLWAALQDSLCQLPPALLQALI